MSYRGFERIVSARDGAIERVCRYCGRAQPLDDFCSNRRTIRGRTWECKICRRKRRKGVRRDGQLPLPFERG